MGDCLVSFQYARQRCSTNQFDTLPRSQNPMVVALCRTLAEMEEADECVVTSYGLGAILSLCLSQLKRGDHVLVAEGCFKAHSKAFCEYMEAYGVAVTFVVEDTPAHWQTKICANTRMAFIAPTLVGAVSEQAGRIRNLAMLFHQACAPGQCIQLVVENSEQGCDRVRPLVHGADFVLYTSTLSLINQPADTQNQVVAGAICGRREAMPAVAKYMKTARVCLSPFNAWALLQGLGATQSQSRALDHTAHADSKDDSGTVVSWPSTIRAGHHEYSKQ